MKRLPVRFARIALSSTLAVTVIGFTPSFAQEAAKPADAPAPATPAAPAAPAPAPPAAPAAPAPADAAPAAPAAGPAAAPGAPDAELSSAVENFWHYGKIARYELAQAEAQKVIAKKDNPAAVLQAFEKVATDRKDNLDEWLIRWQGTAELKDVTSQIITILNDGRRTRRSDPAAIEENVKRLTGTGRGYYLAVQQLRESGELAVPIMIDYLRDPAKVEYHDPVRNALKDLGRLGLNPLVAATETKNPDLVVRVVSILGELGYGAAVPYLDRLATSANASPALRSAASQALSKMGANPQTLNPAEAFYELGEKFYYDNADISADKRDPNAPANVWYWDEVKGLTRIQVTQQIFNEIMAMRACEYSLKLGQASGDAQSLWLAANYKRESELPEGAKDPTRAADQPSAHFYGVESGAQYLNNALARSLKDRDSQVSLRVIKSLQEIIGRTNLFTGNAVGGAPALIDAMSSSDRLVRFESAFAIAAALPAKKFEGQDRVVPLLAEALTQTGTPSMLVVMGDYNHANQVVDELRKGGVAAVGGIGADAAITASNQLPSVDVLVISEEMGPTEVDKTLALASQSVKLSGAAKVILVRSNASPYAARAVNDPSLNISQASDTAGIKAAADAARAKAMAVPMDANGATSYALRAAELLARLAATNTQVFDLSAADQSLLASLNDSRPDVVKAAGSVLAHRDASSAQSALLGTVLGEKTADDVKVSLLKSLAGNAKMFGNRLGAPQVALLDKLVETATNQDVKNGAGEARGALNLPADQAKTLIVKQSRV